MAWQTDREGGHRGKSFFNDTTCWLDFLLKSFPRFSLGCTGLGAQIESRKRDTRLHLLPCYPSVVQDVLILRPCLSLTLILSSNFFVVSKQRHGASFTKPSGFSTASVISYTHFVGVYSCRWISWHPRTWHLFFKLVNTLTSLKY